MSLRGLDTDSFLELEESIAGKPGGRWVTPSNNTQLSLLAISLALACGLFGGMLEGFLPNGFFELVAEAEAEGASPLYAQIFGTISAIVIVFAWWVTMTALIKWTPGKTSTTALLGIVTAWIIVVAVRGLSHFVLVEADWSVVWANRVLLIVGQQMTEQMTQAPVQNLASLYQIAMVSIRTGACGGYSTRHSLSSRPPTEPPGKSH